MAGVGIQILFPLTDKQAQACIVAADCFGVEPWEMALHVLSFPLARQAILRRVDSDSRDGKLSSPR